MQKYVCERRGEEVAILTGGRGLKVARVEEQGLKDHRAPQLTPRRFSDLFCVENGAFAVVGRKKCPLQG